MKLNGVFFTWCLFAWRTKFGEIDPWDQFTDPLAQGANASGYCVLYL